MKRLLVAALFICSGIPAWTWAWSVLPHDPLSFIFKGLFHDLDRAYGIPEAKVIGIPIAAYALGFSLIWLFGFIKDIQIHRGQCSPSQSQLDASGFVVPELGVPHARCTIARNGNAITDVHVTLRNVLLARDGAWVAACALVGAFATLLFSREVVDMFSATTLSMLVVVVAVGAGYLAMSNEHNTIEIVPRAVIVNGKSYYRGTNGFKAFSLSVPAPGEYQLYQFGLQFTYGHARYDLPGAWLQGEAEEIASALNHYLNQVPVAAQASQSHSGARTIF